MKKFNKNIFLDKDIIKLLCEIKDELIYYKNFKKNLRLCVFLVLYNKIFKLDHNETDYLSYAYTT